MIQITKSEFPITVTESALIKAVEAREADSDLTEKHGLRVACIGGGCSGYMYDLDFDDNPQETDKIKEFSVGEGKLSVMIDPKSLKLLQGMTVDYVKTALSEGFKFQGGDKVSRTCGCGKSFC